METNKSTNLKVRLQKDDYFNCGQQYFVTFKYGSEEQQREMFELFEKALIPSYGSHSYRAEQNRDYIMPYLADSNGNMTTERTGIIGGTSIPEDLLPAFIERFVELDGATVQIGNEEMSGTFDLDKFDGMLDSLNTQIELKKDEYFDYGQHYFVTFKYGSKEQQRKMFEAFEQGLIPSYGSNSSRAHQGKEYIMPYLADNNGNMTTENTGIIGGTSIPEDLLPAFIERFVELDGATVKVGNQKISGKFDFFEFDEMINDLGLQVELQKDEYFDYGQHYFVTFKYGSEEQQRKMFEAFEQGLIPSYGSNSSRARQGKDYIMPYLADNNGNMTTENTGIIGGTSIPEDLLPAFIERFVELDGATVKVGNQKISGTFDSNQFEDMVNELKAPQTK